jgi:peptidoglycan/LPS O-acetylase OafA/YrhL
MAWIETESYRRDIDGLRAIAVLAVIAYHAGWLPHGYLGVDVFFVISGYLITRLIDVELQAGRFSIVDFYLRRARRILPLSLALVLVSLAIGLVVMLPDDLENLAQSVVATNFFGNNVLQAITIKNYWDVVNDYKPLMHTWSLGVEEQYYLAYPALLLAMGRRHHRWLFPTLAVLAAASLGLYALPFAEHQKFYYLPFRFFELAVGGLAVLRLKKQVLIHPLTGMLILSLLLLLGLATPSLPPAWLLPTTVLVTVGILASANSSSRLASFLLQNQLAIGIGRISFSLYLWHQILLAYTRYFLVQQPTDGQLGWLLVVTFLLSILTCWLIERPFRNRSQVSNRRLLWTLGGLWLITTLPALYLYAKGGVVRDVPELDIEQRAATRQMHARYNSRVFAYDRPFEATGGKVKVLVIGNSFARDWANVLLESRFAPQLALSYVPDPLTQSDMAARLAEAEVIFYSTALRETVQLWGIDESKLWVVGTKNFGTSMGYFYNRQGAGYFQQRTPLEDGYWESNQRLLQAWGDRYLDLIGKVIDEDRTVPVFTPQRKFISQDCRHWTQAGARFYAELFDAELSALFAHGFKGSSENGQTRASISPP